MNQNTQLAPLIVTVAPNGARKTKQDHPELPITPEELGREAHRCMKAGAAMIHLHIRDEDGKHSLDVDRYRDATAAIKETCGDGIVIQATTEAVGIYNAAQQMEMVRELAPESASMAIRELVPSGSESQAKEFFQEMSLKKVLPHYIVYSQEDLLRFQSLVDGGIIPEKDAFLLFVLGRYSEGQISHPRDLLPFLNVLEAGLPWSVCAFGPLEHAAASAAIAMGGHVRVGFENNMFLKNGDVATNNAALVAQVAEVAASVGRPLASASEVRSVIGA